MNEISTASSSRLSASLNEAYKTDRIKEDVLLIPHLQIMLLLLVPLLLLLLAPSIHCQQPALPLSSAPSYYGEFNGANMGYPPIPNLLPQFQAFNMVGATTEPRRAIPKQADGTDCPMPPECGCLCGRSGGRKKRAAEVWSSDTEPESEIKCTSGKLRRLVEKALSNSSGIQFDLGINSLQNYVLFCQPDKFKQLQFSTDSTKYCHVTRGPVNCLVIQH